MLTMTKTHGKSEIGKRIADARIDRGMTQAELAEASGMKQSAIGEIERGNVARPKRLREIALALGKSESYLLGEDDILSKPSPSDGSTVRPSGAKLGFLPIRGFVRATAWQEVETMNVWESEIYSGSPDPRFAAGEQFFLRVQGDSMNAAKPVPLIEGCLLKCVTFAAWGGDILPGMLVVVHRIREQAGLYEATVKRVRSEPGFIILAPESTNPIHTPIRLKRNGKNETVDVCIQAVVLDIIYPSSMFINFQGARQ